MVSLNTVSRKCRYALRAIFELALRNTANPVKVHDIALAQAIPSRFLEIILAELKHGGFVESRRGNDGGYILARPAENLTIGEVIGFLQDSTRRSVQADWQKPGLAGDYAFSKMWENISGAIADIYNSITFADLVKIECAQREKCAPNYAI